MKRLTAALAASLLCALLGSAAPAAASFGLNDVDLAFLNEDGTPDFQAGSHPFEVTTAIDVNSHEGALGQPVPDEMPKAIELSLTPGFTGDLTAVPRCSGADFLTLVDAYHPACDDSSAIGTATAELSAVNFPEAQTFHAPIYYLEPPPGVAAKLGFIIGTIPTTVNLGIGEAPPYDATAKALGLSQVLEVVGSEISLWGVPADPAHDALRGGCLGSGGESSGKCAAKVAKRPFLTLPRACEGPLTTTWRAASWVHPESWVEGSLQTHDALGNPRGFGGCDKLDYAPRIESKPTSASAESGSGLDFNLDFTDEGFKNPTGISDSDTKEAVVTLPEGVTVNPSIGEGLGVCTKQDLARETLRSPPGEGCPSAAKIGTLHVISPAVSEAIDGEVFLAPQDDPATAQPGGENPFDSLIALHFVLRNEALGVIVKLAVEVEPDPRTGQLVARLKDAPQLPISHFNLHLKTGARAALITPAACGTYTTRALLTPWANPAEPLTATAAFRIDAGVGGGPCPSGGVPPFDPQFEAGSINNNAGSFSPFNMRLIRADGEQDMTKFSAILPPGELGSLAGVGKCPDAAIAAAKSKSGTQELASPSCPADSLIGHTLAGAGVGEALTYVGGRLYLGGPYRGDPLSVISITPAVAGPFDAGTVVVRLALTLNPRTAEVEVDGAASDPIPHILKGIVLKVRDLRVRVDRPSFTLNPTSCEESSVRSTLFGSYLNVLDPADDRPVDLSARYQAANCLNLGFKPRLSLQLKGGTARGAHPALTATYAPRAGDANLAGLITRLPRSAFLDQAHIRTICTRVQFAAKACPKGARYGFIKAFTPLLDQPLEGPVFLRSSNHNLPDLVFDLHGLVDVEVATRIDSVRGGIRATVEDAPDAPLTKVVLRMQGARKGLIVNSTDLCAAKHRAGALFSGHNGKRFKANPVLGASCGGRRG